MTQDKEFQAEVIFLNPFDARRAITELNNVGFDVEVMDWVYPIDESPFVWVIASCAPGRDDDELWSEVNAAVEPFNGSVEQGGTSDTRLKDEIEEGLKRRAEFERRLAGITQREYRVRSGAKMKIVMEESLAAMPKSILEVKDGVILLFNEHVPYPDGWYWHTNPGPLIGPFESIEDASEAAVIASDPGVEIKAFDTRGRIAKLPDDPPGGRVPKLANDPMRKVEIKLAFDELERRGLIRKTGDFREGSPVFAAVDCKLKELPGGLSLLQQNLFRYLQANHGTIETDDRMDDGRGIQHLLFVVEDRLRKANDVNVALEQMVSRAVTMPAEADREAFERYFRGLIQPLVELELKRRKESQP